MDSILNSVKKTLGVDPDLTVWDTDIVMHINSALSTLHQVGVGPENGLAITDETETWDLLIADDDPTYNSVKTYIYMKVRMLFDPPATSYLVAAFEKQIEELEWRLNVRRETTGWVDPNPHPATTEGWW